MADSLEQKVKAKMIYDAQKKKGEASEAAKAERAKKQEEQKNKYDWETLKTKYEAERSKVIKQCSDCKMKYWELWTKSKRAIMDSGVQDKQTKIQEEKTKQDKNREDELGGITNAFSPQINTYIEDSKRLVPSIGEKLTLQDEVKYILTQAEQDFSERVDKQMQLAKSLAKLKSATQFGEFDTDKTQQALANVPLKIDEVIDSLKETLDVLLGKSIAPVMNPTNIDFNPDLIISQIKALIQPVISATNPLTAVVGNIPILGDLIGLLSVFKSGSGQSADIEELKKQLPSPPTLDADITNKVNGVKDNIMMFLMTLPTILIQVIFAMIDVIYSKLKIITSVIPLGGMFPLDLLPSAIEAVPKILQLVKQLPGMVWDLMYGVISNLIVESMSMAFSGWSMDFQAIGAAADDINEQKEMNRAKKSDTPDYNDITNKVYEEKLKKYGYTLMQLKNVQKNYKEIHNGTTTITKYIDNGKDQNLPSVFWRSMGNNAIRTANATVNAAAAVTNMTTFGKSDLNESSDTISKIDQNGTELSTGFDVTTVERTLPSVEDYEKYLNDITGKSDISAVLRYDRIRKVSVVMGEWYETYKDYLDDSGVEVILEEKLYPSTNFAPTSSKYLPHSA